ncbi:MAG: DUF4258 domain-containing protein [Calditrichota bacterium]
MQPEIVGFQLSIHAEAVVKERELDMKWIAATINDPETTILGEDGNMHYIRTISESGNRKLRVVVNPQATPLKIVTVFFDRRLKEKK